MLNLRSMVSRVSKLLDMAFFSTVVDGFYICQKWPETCLAVIFTNLNVARNAHITIHSFVDFVIGLEFGRYVSAAK